VEYETALMGNGIGTLRRNAVLFRTLTVMSLRYLQTSRSRYLVARRIITDERNPQPRGYEHLNNKHKLMSQLNSFRSTRRVIKRYIA
jgi:hypothetical protein